MTDDPPATQVMHEKNVILLRVNIVEKVESTRKLWRQRSAVEDMNARNEGLIRLFYLMRSTYEVEVMLV